MRFLLYWKIVYSIATKFGIKMCPYPAFQLRHSDNAVLFYNNFHTLMKRRKKLLETQPIFKGSYLGNIWRDLVEIWNGQ